MLITLHRPRYQYLGNIILYSGPIRSGKSLLAIYHGLLAVEDFSLERIVTNFELDVNGLLEACKFYHLPHCYQIVSAGQFFLVREPSDLLGFKDALIIFDEAGIYLNARDWQQNKGFFKFIPQIGKGSINCHLFLICQYPDQIDFQAQQMIEFHWSITAKKKYDKTLKMPRLFNLYARLMPAEALGERNSRKTARQKIRERFVLTKKRCNWRAEYLAPIFNCYASGATVDGVPQRGYFKKSQKDEIWQSDFCRFQRPDDWKPFSRWFSLGKMLYVTLLRFNIHKPALLGGRLSKVYWRDKEWNFVIFWVTFALMALPVSKLLSMIFWRFFAF